MSKNNIQYRDFDAVYDVYNTDEAFLTGSGAELIPIVEVDGHRLRQAPGLVFIQLKQAFIDKTREAV